MSETCRPLIEVLAEIEDPRHARGRYCQVLWIGGDKRLPP